MNLTCCRFDNALLLIAAVVGIAGLAIDSLLMVILAIAVPVALWSDHRRPSSNS